MKNKSVTVTNILISIVVIAAIAVFAWTLYRALWYMPESELPAPAYASGFPAQHVASSTLPSRLIIPALHIDANVQHVGIAYSGNIMVPNNFTDVAWFKYGPVPGQKGAAVIDGHVDNGLGLDGVFKHLSDIHVGDDIYIKEASGQRLHFVVQQIREYPYKDVPTDQIFAQNDSAMLDLITCEGAWVQKDRTYDHRIVVFSRLLES